MDFARIKEIRIVDVCLRLAIPLKYRGEWASGNCPIPSHESKSKGTFAVNVKENYWVCHSESCNKRAGKKGGDVISFLALYKGIADADAAKLLAEWFGIKEAPHMARPTSAVDRNPPAKGHQNPNSGSGSVKLMQEVDVWFAEVINRGELEEEEAYLKRIKNAFKGLLIRSFKNGQRVAAGLQPLPLTET
jgi:CHC2-type zinc finger protein